MRELVAEKTLAFPPETVWEAIHTDLHRLKWDTSLIQIATQGELQVGTAVQCVSPTGRNTHFRWDGEYRVYEPLTRSRLKMTASEGRHPFKQMEMGFLLKPVGEATLLKFYFRYEFPASWAVRLMDAIFGKRALMFRLHDSLDNLQKYLQNQALSS